MATPVVAGMPSCCKDTSALYQQRSGAAPPLPAVASFPTMCSSTHTVGRESCTPKHEHGCVSTCHTEVCVQDSTCTAASARQAAATSALTNWPRTRGRDSARRLRLTYRTCSQMEESCRDPGLQQLGYRVFGAGFSEQDTRRAGVAVMGHNMCGSQQQPNSDEHETLERH